MAVGCRRQWPLAEAALLIEPAAGIEAPVDLKKALEPGAAPEAEGEAGESDQENPYRT